jgi:DNA-binding NtrC family response regulator/PAS domain-containing protein
MTSTPRPGDLAPADVEQRLRFERYLTSVATRFLSLPSTDVEGAVTASLADLLDVLDVDRCGFALPWGPEGVRMLQSASRPGVPAQPPGDLATLLPWYARQLRLGRRLVLPRLPEGVPPEGAADAALVTRQGMKSHVALPFAPGGEIVGFLGIATFREYRDWDAALLARLDLLASVFGSALYRREAESRVQALDELNRSTLASLPQALLVVDRLGRVLARNDAWNRGATQGTFPPQGTADLEAVLGWAAANGSCDVGAIDGIRAVVSGESPRHEGLCRHPGASGPRAYAVSATPLFGDEPGAVIVHADVTELSETKAALEASLREVNELKERLEAENLVLREDVRHARGFAEIVGTSAALGRVLRQVEQVAPTDAPVLLLGETGTGKELVARAVHESSRRRERPLVTVNCAALPPALVESELFGYEKGAFTGAVQRTIGRFEVAHGGTIFLDEIGELPIELQAKLLRVLQAGEFERLGSSKTVKVDVRLVAATNRELEREVREGRFRADLYYRLSVFPVALPPLRERREDVPLLVWHFVERRQAALGRAVKRIPDRLMRAFVAYDWPGNVRELQNVVERALIMTTGATLAADPAFLEAAPLVPPVGPKASLAEAERAHIEAVLGECGWKISGPGNAADRLGLKRSTLQFRMKKLGIVRPGA